ncbi:hypothetical protein TNCV_422781 [Trichonephila clavipes]|nr:hypothetical protein TNCV_422781 [Trichonephila clavipes]
MASAVLADPIRALQGRYRGSGMTIKESENYVGSLEQPLLYADDHYLAVKLSLGDHLGKVDIKSARIKGLQVNNFHTTDNNVLSLRSYLIEGCIEWEDLKSMQMSARIPDIDPIEYE